MASFQDDTAADKAVRFVIGAVVGLVVSGFIAIETGAAEFRSFASLTSFCAVAAVATGIAAILFGNVFIERVVRSRWWE